MTVYFPACTGQPSRPVRPNMLLARNFPGACIDEPVSRNAWWCAARGHEMDQREILAEPERRQVVAAGRTGS